MIPQSLFPVAGSGPTDMQLTGDRPVRKHYLASLKAMLSTLASNLAVHPDLIVLSDGRPGYGYWWAHAGWSQGIPVAILAESYDRLLKDWEGDGPMLDYMLNNAAVVDFRPELRSFGVVKTMLSIARGFVIYDCSEPKTRWLLDEVRKQRKSVRLVGRSCE